MRYRDMERGGFSRALLQNKTFVECYQEMLDATVDQLMSCVPRETAKVQQLHLELWALQSFVGRLNHWHKTAQLLTEQSKETSDDVQED